jgi:hypothetical protein
MKLVMNKSVLIKIIKILKWGKIIAKLTAIGTTVSGAITALSGSATTGVALSAAGATTYAATKGLPSQGYEKTKHIPPGRVDKAANILRQQEIAKAARGGQGKSRNPGSQGKTLQGNAYSRQQPAVRHLSGMLTTPLSERKK